MKARIFFVLILNSLLAVIMYSQKKLEIAQIKTPKGEILVWLYDDTPAHKASFIQLANAGYWDSLTFNRVVPDFVIQGGCPDTEEGFKDPDYLLNPEIDTLKHKHKYGTFAAGRDYNPQMISARCQFYIVMNQKNTTRLNGKFTIYGEVIKGMDVAEAIVSTPRDKKDQPLTPVTLDVNIVKMKIRKINKLTNYKLRLSD